MPEGKGENTMATMKKIIALAMALAMCAVCFAGCGAKTNNYAANNTEFFIGGTGPLTGDASSYGISVQEGAQIAIDEINANGGLNGYNFKFDVKDDKATAADAATGYDTLYEAGMQASIGSVTSGSIPSASPPAATPRCSGPSLVSALPTMREAPNRPVRLCQTTKEYSL